MSPLVALLTAVLLYGSFSLVVPVASFLVAMVYNEIQTLLVYRDSTVPLLPRPRDISLLRWIVRGHSINPNPEISLVNFSQWINQATKDIGSTMWRCRGFLGETRLVVASPECIRTIAVSQSAIWVKTPYTLRILDDLIGNSGLVTSSGETHATHKKVIHPAFHHNALVDMLSIFRRHAKQLVARWEAMEMGAETDVYSEVMEATLKIIGHATFGGDVVDESSGGSRVLPAFHRLINPTSSHAMLTALMHAVVPTMLRNLLPFPFLRDRRRSVKEIRQLVHEVIMHRKKTQPENEILLLDRLLGSSSSMTEKEITDHSLTFLFAGHMTTAVLVSWAVVLLSLRPRLMKAVRNEMLQQLPRESADAECIEVLDKLPLLDAVVKETLRVYPPFNMLARQLTSDVEVGGHLLRAGTLVSIPVGAIHRDKDLWGADAGQFKPERWLDGTQADAKFLPFLYGPRGCIGQRFALYEAKVMLQEYLWSSVALRVNAGCEVLDSGPAGVSIPRVVMHA